MGFAARTGEIVAFHAVVAALAAFGTHAALHFHPNRLALTLVEANVCRVELSIARSMFCAWENDVQGVCVGLDLGDVLEALNFHAQGENVELSIVYNGDAKLRLMFSDMLMMEKCVFNTYVVSGGDRSERDELRSSRNVENDHDIDPDSENPLTHLSADDELGTQQSQEDSQSLDSFQLNPLGVICEIVVKSSILYHVLKDMRGLHTEKFILYCNKVEEGYANGNQLMFISQSKLASIGLSKLIVPHTRTNVQQFDVFKFEGREKVPCLNLSLSCNYHYANFAKLLKALRHARSVKIRRDTSGLTSVVLLMGDPNDPHKRHFQGCSLEFTTLESTGMELLGVPLNQSGVGYGDIHVDQIIADDEHISTIRVGSNGQLTLDDYFKDRHQSKEPILGMTEETSRIADEELQITPELAQTLLGGIDNYSPPNGPVSVGKTPTMAVPQVKPQNTLKPPKKGSKKARRAKKPNDGVETVGGAVEIPLFI